MKPQSNLTPSFAAVGLLASLSNITNRTSLLPPTVSTANPQMLRENYITTTDHFPGTSDTIGVL